MAKKTHHIHHHLPKYINFLIIVLAILISFYGVKLINPIISGAAVVDTEFLPIQCTDTDGNDKFTKGNVTLKGYLVVTAEVEDKSLTNEVYEDSCKDNKAVEYTCGRWKSSNFADINGDTIISSPMKSATFNCISGCNEGACIKGLKVVTRDITNNLIIKDAVVKLKKGRRIYATARTDSHGAGYMPLKESRIGNELIAAHRDYFELKQAYNIGDKTEELLTLNLIPKTTVKVIDQFSNPVQAIITIKDLEKNTIKKAKANTKGELTFALEKAPYLIFDEAENYESNNKEGRLINKIIPGEDIVITMNQFNKVTIRTSDSNGNGINNVLIDIYDSEDNHQSGFSNSEGALIVFLEQDDYKIRASSTLFQKKSIDIVVDKNKIIDLTLNK